MAYASRARPARLIPSSGPSSLVRETIASRSPADPGSRQFSAMFTRASGNHRPSRKAGPGSPWKPIRSCSAISPQNSARCSIDQRCKPATPSTPTRRASLRTLVSRAPISGIHAGAGGRSGSRSEYAAAKHNRCTAKGIRVSGSGSASTSRTIRCQRCSPVGSAAQRAMRFASAAASSIPSAASLGRTAGVGVACASIRNRGESAEPAACGASPAGARAGLGMRPEPGSVRVHRSRGAAGCVCPPGAVLFTQPWCSA